MLYNRTKFSVMLVYVLLVGLFHSRAIMATSPIPFQTDFAITSEWKSGQFINPSIAQTGWPGSTLTTGVRLYEGFQWRAQLAGAAVLTANARFQLTLHQTIPQFDFGPFQPLGYSAIAIRVMRGENQIGPTINTTFQILEEIGVRTYILQGDNVQSIELQASDILEMQVMALQHNHSHFNAELRLKTRTSTANSWNVAPRHTDFHIMQVVGSVPLSVSQYRFPVNIEIQSTTGEWIRAVRNHTAPNMVNIGMLNPIRIRFRGVHIEPAVSGLNTTLISGNRSRNRWFEQNLSLNSFTWNANGQLTLLMNGTSTVPMHIVLTNTSVPLSGLINNRHKNINIDMRTFNISGTLHGLTNQTIIGEIVHTATGSRRDIPSSDFGFSVGGAWNVNVVHLADGEYTFHLINVTPLGSRIILDSARYTIIPQEHVVPLPPPEVPPGEQPPTVDPNAGLLTQIIQSVEVVVYWIMSPFRALADLGRLITTTITNSYSDGVAVFVAMMGIFYSIMPEPMVNAIMILVNVTVLVTVIKLVRG